MWLGYCGHDYDIKALGLRRVYSPYQGIQRQLLSIWGFGAIPYLRIAASARWHVQHVYAYTMVSGI